MAGVNQFKQFAGGGGANTLTPSVWAGLTTLLANGFQAGVASSEQANTLFRQVSTAAAGLAQYAVSQSGDDALDNGDPNAFAALLLAAIQATVDARVAASAVPPGMMQGFMSATAPAGWLECDGSSQLVAAYPNLSATVRPILGGADASHFWLPDARGVVLRGWDHGRGLDPGRVLGSYQPDSLLAHTHGVNDPGHSHTYQSRVNTEAAGPVSLNDRLPLENATTSTSTTGITIQSTGGVENRVKSLAVIVCIKY